MTKKTFPEGVEITLPDKYKHLKVKNYKDKGKLPSGKSGRIVMKFELYDPDDEDKKVDKFDQPFELRVKYTKADEDRAGGDLHLEYNPGPGWIPFNKVNMIPNKNKKGGVGVVEIHDWDPAVGWFP